MSCFYPATFLILIALAAAPATAAQKGSNQIVGWGRFADSDGDCSYRFEGGKLTIAVPGKPHDLSAELGPGHMNAPRVLQEVQGDFIVQVKVRGTFAPGVSLLPERTPYHGAGLLLIKDEKTYLRMSRAKIEQPADRAIIAYAAFELREDAHLSQLAAEDNVLLNEQKDVYLRLERHGNMVVGAVGQDPCRWDYLSAKSVALPATVGIGVYAANDSDKGFAPEFSDFKLFRLSEKARRK